MIKRLVKNKWWAGIIASLVVIILSSGVFAAVAYTKTLPSTVNIVPGGGPLPPPQPTYSIETYSDPECTAVVNSLAWGDLTQGSSLVKTLYVKNTGTGAVVSVDATDTITTGGLSIDVVWVAGNSSLAAGEVKEITVTLSATGTATQGAASFDLNLAANS